MARGHQDVTYTGLGFLSLNSAAAPLRLNSEHGGFKKSKDKIKTCDAAPALRRDAQQPRYVRQRAPKNS